MINIELRNKLLEATIRTVKKLNLDFYSAIEAIEALRYIAKEIEDEWNDYYNQSSCPEAVDLIVWDRQRKNVTLRHKALSKWIKFTNAKGKSCI